MNRILLLMVSLVILMPAGAHALSSFHGEAISGKIGIPFCWEINGMGLRYFPTKDLLISRLGIDAYAGREGQFTHGGMRYSITEVMPLRLLAILFPSSISYVDKDNPFYLYLFFGTGVSAYCHEVVDNARAWGGGGTRLWNGGLVVSFLSTVEIELGYMHGSVEEYLGVNENGDLVQYSPGLSFDRFYCACKIGINSALIRWD